MPLDGLSIDLVSDTSSPHFIQGDQSWTVYSTLLEYEASQMTVRLSVLKLV